MENENNERDQKIKNDQDDLIVDQKPEDGVLQNPENEGNEGNEGFVENEESSAILSQKESQIPNQRQVDEGGVEQLLDQYLSDAEKYFMEGNNAGIYELIEKVQKISGNSGITTATISKINNLLNYLSNFASKPSIGNLPQAFDGKKKISQLFDIQDDEKKMAVEFVKSQSDAKAAIEDAKEKKLVEVIEIDTSKPGESRIIFEPESENDEGASRASPRRQKNIPNISSSIIIAADGSEEAKEVVDKTNVLFDKFRNAGFEVIQKNNSELADSEFKSAEGESKNNLGATFSFVSILFPQGYQGGRNPFEMSAVDFVNASRMAKKERENSEKKNGSFVDLVSAKRQEGNRDEFWVNKALRDQSPNMFTMTFVETSNFSDMIRDAAIKQNDSFIKDILRRGPAIKDSDRDGRV